MHLFPKRDFVPEGYTTFPRWFGFSGAELDGIQTCSSKPLSTIPYIGERKNP
jgi:hypothetical protein